jgi:hypothetical protein
MKFIAHITIEVEADTFAAAADQERAINKSYQDLRENFSNCRLAIKQRRSRSGAPPEARVKRMRYTGNLATYG